MTPQRTHGPAGLHRRRFLKGSLTAAGALALSSLPHAAAVAASGGATQSGLVHGLVNDVTRLGDRAFAIGRDQHGRAALWLRDGRKAWQRLATPDGFADAEVAGIAATGAG
ncbi:MAG: hypothetical protein ACRDU8_04570, partial [Egibacteraceae bacterium]